MATIRSVAEKLGCTVEALRRWVRQTERDAGKCPGSTTDERGRQKQLEKENFELRRAHEILKKGVGIFRTSGARPPREVERYCVPRSLRWTRPSMGAPPRP